MRRILFATGGSGGHVYPVVAIARAVDQLSSQTMEMEIIGSSRFFDDLTDLAVPIRHTWDAKIRRYLSVLNFMDFLKLPVILVQSFFYIWRFMPDVVLAKGGYASVVPALVARLFFIPVYIHESDAVPGVANRLLARRAKKIFISFESSAQYFNPAKTVLVGDPVRTELLTGDRTQGLAFFQLTGQKPVLLVLGGSQGAERINAIIRESLVGLIEQFQIIHQCGEKNYQAYDATLQQIIKEGSPPHSNMSSGGEGSYGPKIMANYRLYPFLSSQEMALAYAACDLIISRAGAGSLFEIAALGKPAIIIPITNSAGDHQRANAREFAKFGGRILEEQNLTPLLLAKAIDETHQRRVELGQQIRGFAKLDAAQMIAQELLKS